MEKRLNGFDAKLLSLVGRIVLVKSVLLAIPGILCNLAMVPDGVCERIEQIVRNFVWRTTRNERKMHIVEWDICFRPMTVGALS